MLAGYTEDDLKGLSEAERAILAGDDDGEDNAAELEALAGKGEEGGADEGSAFADADADDGDGQAGGHEDGEGGEGADASAAAAIGSTDEDGGVVDADDERFAAQSPADADTQRLALQARKDEAFKQLMDGEMQAAQYQAVEKEVNGELQKLLAASITDSVTATLAQAQTTQAWDREVKAMLRAAAAEGLDYKGNKALASEFDSLVRVFGAEATAKGMDDANLKASKWALQQAHVMMRVRHGMAAPPTPAAEAGRPGTRPRQAPDLRDIPPSLSRAPVAAAASSGGDEFAHLGGLKGADLERALARMTADQQDRYLS